MPSIERCQREIEAVHAFFVRWYCGEAADEEFDRFERALAPSFELVSPDGERLSRETVLSFVADNEGAYEPGEFDIEVGSFESIAMLEDHAVVRYVECQSTRDAESGRISSALLHETPEAPEGLEWLHLQETWIDRG